jgi:16S rRNA (cytosine967-C5)-methyltransferase
VNQSSTQASRLRADAATILFRILEQGQSSRQCLADKQAHYKQPRDKAWLQEMVFGSLRRLPTLQFWVRQSLQNPLKGNKKVIEHLLMIGFYQLAYSRVSPHAAVAETVNATKHLKAETLKNLVNAVLRNFQRSELIKTQPEGNAAKAGFSNWIYHAISEAYGDDADDIVEATNEKAPLWLRVNQQQIKKDTFCDALKQKNIEFTLSDNHHSAVILAHSTEITELPGYHKGWFAVQDGAAQLAATYLAPTQDERLLDCCAAPGGKTCHLVEIEPSIDCIALDNDKKRLTRLSENLQRLRLNATVLCADATQPNKWWDGKPFDRILLDAPCSATGVIRRHPDIRWLRKKQDIEPLVAIQQRLLNTLWELLKPGGTLLYATCSILPEENQKQITHFLTTQSNARLVPLLNNENTVNPGRQILPGEENMDGFYYARLQKTK